MTIMDTTVSASAATSRQHLNRTATLRPCGDSSNGGRHQTDRHEACTHHELTLPPFTLQSSGERPGNNAPQPPILLLSRRCRQDPAVMRLRADLALRETSSSGSVISEPQAALSEAVNSAVTPKKRFSLGYDDDAALPPFSIPEYDSRTFSLQGEKSPVSSSEISSTLLTSGGESSAASSETEITVTAKNHTSTKCYWISRQPQGLEERHEGSFEPAHEEEINKGLQTLPFDFDQKSATLQETESGMSNSESCVRGVPTASSSAAWETDESKANTDEDEEDTALSHHEEDEVLGVTAEGEFIYRRDVDAERSRLGKANYKCYQDSCWLLDGHGDDEASCMLAPAASFCTPEKNIFATGLSSRARMSHRHGEEVGARRNMTATSSSTPLQLSAVLPQRRSIGASRQRKTRKWATSDVEWCSLLLQYRTCENADEMQYKELVGAVDSWHEAQRRYHLEALEQRLLEEDSYERPPFILRW
ncbi:hypothetical protein TraAM80_03195 [Trypanosoma rangeli]|uniref:Uncharacterized protein n=1 Tax=Trypanosoma rangeli TaxID=5698 RepID=A0A422NQJ2_TRYRA|nr:uncharacterized protein TraAM80_03195 [Trypanosoma rangeli]RNF07748.1 hypothetical protein TraAM80_03195 [Trypanosoma rangeli]|eukprot:RNF07748.1 hypothetical protein TraAM80_03195 [Trypanosoma rangeli]